MNERPIIGTMKELLDAIRARREYLNLSMDTLDAIANLPERYSIKVLGPNPKRGLSYMNLGAIMGALGIGLQIVEDPRTTKMVSGDWQQRKRVVPKPQYVVTSQAPVASIGISEQMRALRRLVTAEHCSMGGIGRARALDAKRRREIARAAAMARWSKSA